MRYIRHETTESEITIYPIVCMHVGARQCAEEFIKEHVDRIADDARGVAVYLGDAGDCSLKGSKGDVYSQTLSPGEQQVRAAELLKPIHNKLVFGISGNHGRRVDKETGLSWDDTFCLRLGIPFLGLAAFMRLQVRKTHYDIYFHHGATSSINTGGKVNAALKFNAIVEADAILTAHSHICTELPVQTIACLPQTVREVQWRTAHSYVCGCAYDSRTGYAEEKGYAPILPAYLGVTFSGIRNNNKSSPALCKEQTCRIWRATP